MCVEKCLQQAKQQQRTRKWTRGRSWETFLLNTSCLRLLFFLPQSEFYFWPNYWPIKRKDWWEYLWSFTPPLPPPVLTEKCWGLRTTQHRRIIKWTAHHCTSGKSIHDWDREKISSVPVIKQDEHANYNEQISGLDCKVPPDSSGVDTINKRVFFYFHTEAPCKIFTVNNSAFFSFKCNKFIYFTACLLVKLMTVSYFLRFFIYITNKL